MTVLPPLPVAVPLAAAGLLLATGKLLPRRGPGVVAIAVSLAVCALCALLVSAALDGPVEYWFGGWTPRDGQAIGIAFRIDVAGAVLACFGAGLFAITMVFAWGFYEKSHAHFHVLMLLFMSGMVGFCLTGDIFNLFVWFELMSVAAFSLTGFELRAAPLQGAINFTVINGLGGYMLLGGIGLAYAAAGSLDMASLGRFVAAHPADPVMAGAFVLMGTGLLIKGAQVPFHFWLPDAHAVAPSPVSVIFSGAMVAMGLFGVLRLLTAIFVADPAIMAVTHTLLLGMGIASTLVGGTMALFQRHLKRLLAFSTVSHAGVMLIGVALPGWGGTAGMLTYLVGHGLVKATLFMIAGIFLATLGGVDEIGLRGRGRAIWPVGPVMLLAGLLLGGLPLGVLDLGLAGIAAGARAAGQGWVAWVLVFGAATTGGAVLRATGRIFLGLGEIPGEEEHAPTDDERENADRPLSLMLGAACVPLVLVCAAAAFAPRLAGPAATQLLPPGTPVIAHAEAATLGWIAVGIATLLATYDLIRPHRPDWLAATVGRVTKPLAAGLETLHSGAVGDYVAWLAVGLALFTLAFSLV